MPVHPQTCRWHPYDALDALQEAAVQAIVRCAREAIMKNGRFRIVLAGGNTPRAVYEKLKLEQTDWSRWEIYYGDERCVPPDHPDRNSLMAHDALLSHVPIPHDHDHPIPAELGPADGARRYAETLQNVGDFDLVLLGLGEDGHTASLFPGKHWGDEDTVAVLDSPKPPPGRISLSPGRLAAAHRVFFLVSGAKQQAVADWRAGKPIPASRIAPAYGVDIYIESHLLG